MRLFVILATVVALITANKITYDNYKVFKILVKTESEVNNLMHLVESNKEYTFWSGPSTSALTAVMVGPRHVADLLSAISALGLTYERTIDDVQSLIEQQVANHEPNDGAFNWTRYHSLDEINAWLDSLAREHPRRAEAIVAGRSHEGRAIKGLRISSGASKPGVFVEAGIHANEWIGPAVATYLAHELLASREPRLRGLAQAYDWYIVPSVNVDGYAYTFSTDRMWRKNRSASGGNCTGVDLNRNWDYMWSKTGASNDTCSNMYAGRRAFSEMETKTFSEYVRSVGDRLFAYIDFHAFSQLLMVPYGHTKEPLDNYNETIAIGLKSAKALARRYGTEYKVGNIAEAIYPASGSSLDWVKATLKLPIAFAYELRDKGKYGMLLPPEQIVPTGQEILDSLVVMLEEAKKLGYPQQ